MFKHHRSTKKLFGAWPISPAPKKLMDQIKNLRLKYTGGCVFDKKWILQFLIKISTKKALSNHRNGESLFHAWPIVLKTLMHLCHNDSIYFFSHLQSKTKCRIHKWFFHIFNLKISRIIKIKMAWWGECYFPIKTSVKINQKQMLFPLLIQAMKLIIKRRTPSISVLTNRVCWMTLYLMRLK